MAGKSIERMRAEFEAWAGQYGYSLERDHEAGGYYADGVDVAWSAWQASRAALVVELPEPYPQIRFMDHSAAVEVVTRQYREAIESAGVRVKE